MDTINVQITFEITLKCRESPRREFSSCHRDLGIEDMSSLVFGGGSHNFELSDEQWIFTGI